MIDTLKFARRMADAGMDPKVAERLAEELDDALKGSDLVTRADLKTAVAELKAALAVWAFGIALAVISLTLGGVYFMLTNLKLHP
jgi:hypothetical protein